MALNQDLVVIQVSEIDGKLLTEIKRMRRKTKLIAKPSQDIVDNETARRKKVYDEAKRKVCTKKCNAISSQVRLVKKDMNKVRSEKNIVDTKLYVMRERLEAFTSEVNKLRCKHDVLNKEADEIVEMVKKVMAKMGAVKVKARAIGMKAKLVQGQVEGVEKEVTEVKTDNGFKVRTFFESLNLKNPSQDMGLIGKREISDMEVDDPESVTMINESCTPKVDELKEERRSYGFKMQELCKRRGVPVVVLKDIKEELKAKWRIEELKAQQRGEFSVDPAIDLTDANKEMIEKKWTKMHKSGNIIIIDGLYTPEDSEVKEKRRTDELRTPKLAKLTETSVGVCVVETNEASKEVKEQKRTDEAEAQKLIQLRVKPVTGLEGDNKEQRENSRTDQLKAHELAKPSGELIIKEDNFDSIIEKIINGIQDDSNSAVDFVGEIKKTRTSECTTERVDMETDLDNLSESSEIGGVDEFMDDSEEEDEIVDELFKESMDGKNEGAKLYTERTDGETESAVGLRRMDCKTIGGMRTEMFELEAGEDFDVADKVADENSEEIVDILYEDKDIVSEKIDEIRKEMVKISIEILEITNDIEVIKEFDHSDGELDEEITNIKRVLTKSFKCDSCTNSFSNERNLNIHKKLHINREYRQEPQRKPVRLTERLRRLQNLEEHQNHEELQSQEVQRPVSLTERLRRLQNLEEHQNQEEHQWKLGSLTERLYRLQDLEENENNEEPQSQEESPKELGSLTERLRKLQDLLLAKDQAETQRKPPKQKKPQEQVEHRCFQCGLVFKRYTRLLLHRSIHANEPIQCETCGKICPSRRSYNYHMNEHGFRPDSDSVQCEVCGKFYSNQKVLEAHRQLHLGPRSMDHECSYCSRRFHKRSQLNAHVILHTGTRTFVCEICEKAFLRKKGLDCHKLTHLSVKPFACEICQKRFSNPFNYRRHLVIHTGLKNFQCSECGKAFRHKEDLKHHVQRKHNPESLRRKCDMCDREYLSKQGLDNHRSRVHFGLDPQSQIAKVAQCEVCGKMMSCKASLSAHMVVHTKEKNYHCEVCGKAFGYKSGLYIHKTIHTGEKRHQCQECGRTFNKSSNLWRHKLLHSNVKKFACQICDRKYKDKGTMHTHMLTHNIVH